MNLSVHISRSQITEKLMIYWVFLNNKETEPENLIGTLELPKDLVQKKSTFLSELIGSQIGELLYENDNKFKYNTFFYPLGWSPFLDEQAITCLQKRGIASMIELLVVEDMIRIFWDNQIVCNGSISPRRKDSLIKQWRKLWKESLGDIQRKITLYLMVNGITSLQKINYKWNTPQSSDDEPQEGSNDEVW